jgi:putative transposase
MGEVPSQVLQQAIKQLHVGWEYFQKQGFGFPRFKKYGQFKSLLFPQFKENPVTNLHIKLPKDWSNSHQLAPTLFPRVCGQAGENLEESRYGMHL